MAESPVYGAPPQEGSLCPRCGRVFEVPFVVGSARLAGHPIGHPKLCVPVPTMDMIPKDARARKALRRGR